MFEIEGDSSAGNVNSELPAELDDLFDDRPTTSGNGATDPPTGNGSQTQMEPTAPPPSMPPHSQPHSAPYRGGPPPFSDAAPSFSTHNASVSVTSTPLHPQGYPPNSAPYHPGGHHSGGGGGPPQQQQHHPSQNNSVLQGLLRNNPSNSGPPPEMNGPRSVGPPSGNPTPSPQRPPTGPPHGAQGPYGRSPASAGMGGIGSPPPNPAPPPPSSRHPSGPGGRPPDGGQPPNGPGFPASSMGPAYSQPGPGIYASAPVASSAPPPISGMQPRMMVPSGMNGPMRGAPRQAGPRGAPMHMGMQEPMAPNRMPHSRMQMSGYGPPEGMGYSNGMGPQGMRHPPPEYIQSGQGGGPPMQPNAYRHMAPQPPFQQPQPMNPMGGGMGGGGGGSMGMGDGGGGGGGMGLPPSTGGPGGPPSAGGGPNGPGGAGGHQDPEKRKLIQQQLVLLLHAHKCQQRESQLQGGGPRQECTLPHCSTMKGVLSHMTNCTAGRSCQYAHCASSRQIIQHWKNCNRGDCPVCLPLKTIANDGSGRNPAADPSIVHIISGGAGPPGGVVNGRPGGPLAGFPSSSAANGPPPPNAVIGPGQSAQPPRPPNAPSGQITNQLPPPENADNVKGWHRQVTADLRNHLVGKLVKAIFPSPDPSAIHDQRIKDLIQYARKVEKDMFEFANDREEYYHLLAEKIYKIQKELQDKKAKREQIQRTGVPNSQEMLKDMDMAVPPNRVAPGGMGGPPSNGSGPSFAAPSGLPPGHNLPYSSKSEDIKPDINAIKEDIASASMKMDQEGVKKEEPEDEGGKGGSGVVKASTTPATPRPKPSSPPKPSAPIKDKEFPPNQLRNYLMPVWEKLEGMEEAIPFRVPVDPELLQIPDYFDIIKHPMDLSTIKEKLNNGEYSNPWAFCDDIWLMLENAWVYNKKNSKVYKYCTKMSEWFVTWMDPVMRELGFCCGRRMAFTPLPIFCYGKPMCAIPRDHEYFSYNASSSQFGVVVSDNYQYCLKCFENLPDVINLGDDPSSNKMVAKTEFKRCKNDQVEYEPFVHCQYCGRKWHNICALYNEKVITGGFSCASCLQERKQSRPDTKTTAKRLPQCKLSRHIEGRVMRYLEERVKEGGMARKDCHDVHIRVLASADKEVELKPLMKAKFAQPHSVPRLPEKSPYRTKAIFAFQSINGNEVCFFGLYVQEYGTAAAKCNQRRVYIAYLDSVHYYEPRSERTNVYHQILLGYLEYVKTLGFTLAHLWACPPSEGDDYIFHCHPPEQKIPRQNRLKEWYKKMLDKGVVDRIVMDYRDILRDAQLDAIATPADLPYFEGDFWPSVFEDCIREFNKEEDERRRQEEQEADDPDVPDPDGSNPPPTDKASGKSKKGKGQKRKGGHNKKGAIKKSKKGVTGNDLMDKVLVHMEKHKDVFFVIRLISIQQASVLGPIEDPDTLVNCDLMDVRDNFLNRAREEHWEFSSKRRATYSTMCLTHALHTQGRELETYTCNNCNSSNATMHCTTCDDFDLCAACYGKVTHEHRMEKIQSLVGDGGDDGRDKSDQNSRNESIQRCIQSLVHACQCRDANCRRLSCHKMKRVVQHTKLCKKRQAGHCPVCKQLIALCCYHAKHCVEAQCQVPFCTNIRLKLEEQRKAQRRQQDRMMQRRMKGMYQMNQMNQNPNAATPAPSPGGAPPSMVHANSVGHNLGGGGGPQQPPATMGHSMSMSSFPNQQQQPSPLMGGDNNPAMEAARNAQRIALQQQQQRMGGQGGPPGGPRMATPNYGRSLPIHSAPPGQPPMGQQRQAMPGQMSMEGRVGMMGMDQQGAPPRGRGGPAQGPGGRQMDPKVVAILNKLKSARDQTEHNQILQELSKDPQLMSSFIAMKNNLPQQGGGGGGMGRGGVQQMGGQGYGGPRPGGPQQQQQQPQQQQQQYGYGQGGGGGPPMRGGYGQGGMSYGQGQGPPFSGGPGGSPGGPFAGVRSPQGSLRSPSTASPALHQQGSLPPSLDPPAAGDFRDR